MLAAFLAIACASGLPFITGYHREWDGHVNGLYWKSDTFASIPHRQLDNLTMKYGDEVYRSGIRHADSARERGVLFARPEGYWEKVRFAIAGEIGQFSGGSWIATFPVTDLPLLESTDWGHELFDLKFNPKHAYVSSQYTPFKADTSELFFPKHRPWDISKEDLRIRLLDQGLVFEPDIRPVDLFDLKFVFLATVVYDILPIDAKSLRFFHAIDGRMDISVEAVPYSSPGESLILGKKPPPIPERNLKSGKLPASFKGRFHAYVVGDLHYLLTAGGRLYKCAPKGKDGLEITEVWSDPARPIIGIVDVPETKQAFAFGWGSKPKNTDRYWIEFGDKPVETVYELKAKLKNDREDAFREVNDCVRALKAAKALKPVPKPEPKK